MKKNETAPCATAPPAGRFEFYKTSTHFDGEPRSERRESPSPEELAA